MNAVTMTSFRDEVEKIAVFKALGNALHEGWHGTPEQIAAGNPNSWMGQGTKITKNMGRVGKAWERFSSLGGLTKALPVGTKSMTALSTGLMAQQALKPNDPSGQGRSRGERMTGLAGNTVGGLIGGALASRAMPGSGLVAPIVGSIAGGMVGEKAVTLPWSHARKMQPVGQQLQQQLPVPPEYWQHSGQQAPQQPQQPMPAPGVVR